MNCALHPEREACPETEDWQHELCSECWCALGEPGVEPMWGALRGIGSEIQWAEHVAAAPDHPEVVAYSIHFQTDQSLRMAAR